MASAASSSIILEKGREKSLLRRHPWVFSRAIKSVQGKPEQGETVNVVDAHGNWLAYAAYSPQSQIRARVWSFNKEQAINLAFFIERLQQAQTLRDPMIQKQGLNSYRLFAAESDRVPGIIIDRYADILVLQLLSAGAEYNKALLIEALEKLYPECRIYERSDVSVRKKEGLKQQKGPIKGEFSEDVNSTIVELEENHGVHILIDVAKGHKTGYYLDQKTNRAIAGSYCKDKSVLNCFSYTGGFGVYALKSGAKSITNVDVSARALAMAKRNCELNQLDLNKAEFIEQDVFKLLREYKEQGKRFDTIILDPPKFAENKNQLKGACRGYKDINMLAFSLLNKGGTLLTFSCSGLMDSALFQKIVADAALDAKRDACIVERLSQSDDHPIALEFPEGFYLKGLVVKVSN